MRMRPGLMLSTLFLALTNLTASADTPTVDVSEEYAKRIHGQQDISPLGTTLAGDEISTYLGTLSFSATDISLPGPGEIPVSLGRRYNLGNKFYKTNHFADWELDIPRIQGTFSNTVGWRVEGDAQTGPSARCTNFVKAREATGDGGQPAGAFDGREYWSGTSLYVPGQGSQEILQRVGGNTLTPPPPPGKPYNLVTTGMWMISCEDSVADVRQASPGVPETTGEAFSALSPDGTRYTFNWLASHRVAGIVKSFENPAPSPGETPTYNVLGSYSLSRSDYWMMPTRIEDRFGNWVTYTYDSNTPWKLLSISAKDGRRIQIKYDDAANPSRITSIDAGYWQGNAFTAKRTWSYAYTTAGELQKVTLPDGSYWQLTLQGLANASLFSGISHSTCENNGIPHTPFSGTIRHPSGATASFTVMPTNHGRAGVEKNCTIYTVQSLGDNHGDVYWIDNRNPRQINQLSITTKTLTGPGLGTMTWEYHYGTENSSWQTECAGGCVDTKTVEVIDPEGSKVRYTFGNRERVNEGQLLKTETFGLDPATSTEKLLRTESYAYAAPEKMPIPHPFGDSVVEGGDKYTTTHILPQKQRTINQDGVDFTWQVGADSAGNLSIDAYGNVLSAVRSSTLGYGKNEAYAYETNLQKWVLGLKAKVTNTKGPGTADDIVELKNTYDPSTSLLQTVEQFGRTVATMTYWDDDGSLRSKTDGNNKRTDYNNYKLGIPREIKFHDSTTQTAVVDDLGQIASVTNEKQETTTYQYDDIGRLKRVIYPTGDTVAWADTTNTFIQPGTNDFALGGNQWVQTVKTGNGVKQVYYDGLFRPVVTLEYDATTQAQANATSRYTVRAFDSQGHTTYSSYPFNAPVGPSGNPGFSYFSRPKGTYASFDALGRLVATSADSEYGADAATRLTTTTAYLTGFKRQVTDPLFHVSTTEFQAFDAPSYDAPMKITAPMGVTVEIGRDEYGKPSSIKRSGNWTNAAGQVAYLPLTRSYYYDSTQRLCKAIDPESGATFTHYDGDNVDWTASSKAQVNPGCDRDSLGGALDASKVSRFYDDRHRLTKIDYPGTTSDVDNTYWGDGRLKTTATGGSLWFYEYNRRGLLWHETLTIDAKTFVTQWVFNGNGHLNSIIYPGETYAVDLAPNALGQPTQVGSFAGKVHYLPNSAVDSFEYGNRVLHSMTPNARQLPFESKDSLGSTVLLDDEYTYDKNGNVKKIVDKALQDTSSRSMTYDDLDRLIGVDAPKLWGESSLGTEAKYVYDSLDNLRTAKVGTSTKTFTIDGSNRLTEVTGNPGFSLSYDDQGNVKTRGTQNYTFDLANRLISATVIGSDAQPHTETYTYDGHGRRTSIALGNAPKRYQMYSNAGQLLYERDLVADTTTLYYYLGNSLVARKDYAPVLLVNQRNLKTTTAPPFGGRFTLIWDASAISSAPRYEVEGSRDDSGTWTQYYNGLSRSYTVPDPQPDPEGGSYMFRVRACDPSTLVCEPWSYLEPVGVLPRKAVLTVQSSAAGSFPVQWTLPLSTTRFELEESFNGGSWVPKRIGTPLTNTYTVVPNAAGTYAYRVKAYNAFGARDWAVSSAVNVTAVASMCRPTLSVNESSDPANPGWILSTDGDYVVSWTCSTGPTPTSYEFQEIKCPDLTHQGCYVDPPNFFKKIDPPALSLARFKSSNGQFEYQVRACSSGGCGPWSVAASVRVARTAAPADPTGLVISPNPAPFGAYTLSWNASSDPAVVYELVEGVGTNPEVQTAVTLPVPNATSMSFSGKPNGSYRYILHACKNDQAGNKVCSNDNWVTQEVKHDVSFYLSLFEDDENGTTPPNNHTPSSTGPELNQASPYRLATLKYYHTDALGSPVLVTNEGGGIDGTRRYYQPYGAPTDGSYQNGPGYTGHVADTFTQLTYAQQRYYDPMLGRFLSMDPVGVDGTQAVNFNRYAYAANNPYRYLDPDGRMTMEDHERRQKQEDDDQQREKEKRSQQAGKAIADAMTILLMELPENASPDGGGGDGGIVGAILSRGSTAAELPMAGSIRSVNAVGGDMNCVNCAIATDATLAGNPASALRDGPQPITVLEEVYGARWSGPGPIGNVTKTMTAAGPGARGIVYGSLNPTFGHVFNVVNQGGAIRYLDGQAGGAAWLNGYRYFQVLRTN